MNGRRAAWLIVAAAVLGFVAQLLFFGVPLGLNVPLMIAALLGAARLARPAEARLDPLDAWLPLAALALASFVALRTDPAVIFLDTLGALALTGASAAAFAGVPVMRRSGMALAVVIGAVVSSVAVAAGPLVVAANRVYRPAGIVAGAPAAGPLVRGIAIAAPIVLIFVVLFASADAVFAEIVVDVLTPSFDLSEAIGRSLYAVAAAWLCAGLLAFTALGPRLIGRAEAVVREPASAERSRGWLGATEALVVLISVDLLFAAFVGVQATYLFGGRDAVAGYGFSYSDYARRGFFELVFVAVLVGALVMTLEHGVRARPRAFVVAAVALCVLTGVVLGSAALRLALYQQAFGWTELRFYVAAAIVWLALGVLLTIGALALNRSRWLLHGLGVAALLVTLVVNGIGPQRFIASQNVARALDETLVATGGTTGLDEVYLAGLGDDAVPVILEAFPELSPADREALAWPLYYRLLTLDADAGSRDWQGWNHSRERAREALEAVREDLRTLSGVTRGSP